MRVFRHHGPLPPEFRGAVAAIGNFDGVHRGHQAVIGQAGALARAAGRPHAVLTFEPHPRSVFRPDLPPFRLTPFRVKARALEALGVDIMVSLHFDRAFAERTAENFIQDILADGLGLSRVVIGDDFVFGHGRRGNADLLRDAGPEHGFGVTIVPPVTGLDGTVYSSTRIRQALADGDPQQAASLLGRLWEIDGRVERGDARGRTIGFPTANLSLGDYLRPRGGVYAVRVGIAADDGVVWHDAVANLGTRPTVAGTDLRLEAHLLRFSGDLYGQAVRAAFVGWIRPEQKFTGLDALKARIAQDVAVAELILAARGRDVGGAE